MPFDDLLHGASHVVVVPHSLLHGVPIHALTYRDGILLDATTVSYAPSAAVFAASAGMSADATARGQHNGHHGRIERPLIVAPDIPDLPWVADEARRIAALFPDAISLTGAAATLDSVRREARTCDTLHLATHGVFRSDNPTYSALELADGWLSVGELAELSGGRALVCLSACHTGDERRRAGRRAVGSRRGLCSALARRRSSRASGPPTTTPLRPIWRRSTPAFGRARADLPACVTPHFRRDVAKRIHIFGRPSFSSARPDFLAVPLAQRSSPPAVAARMCQKNAH